MTVRHVRFEIAVLGHDWHDVADLDDTDPIVAALIADGRLTVVSGTPGPAQSYHATTVLYSVTAPDVTGLAAGTGWMSATGLSVLVAGDWTPITTSGGGGGGGGAAAVNNSDGTATL